MRKTDAPTGGPDLTSSENRMVGGFVDGYAIDGPNAGSFRRSSSQHAGQQHRISRTAPATVNEKFSGPTFLSIFIHFYRQKLHFYDLSSF